MATTMKTIGVLGGIGPQATMDFEALVHRAAQRALPQSGNTGYPPLISMYLRHAPVAVDEEELPIRPLRLDERVLDAARWLGERAQLLAIPSNTPHYFLDEIEQASGCEVVSLIDAAVAALPGDDGRPVGLVGLGIPDVYVKRLDALDRRYVTASEPTRDALDRAILRLMEGAEGAAERDAARAALREVRAAGAGATILGCSEIPLLLGDDARADDLIHPTERLAEEVVRRAVG